MKKPRRARFRKWLARLLIAGLLALPLLFLASNLLLKTPWGLRQVEKQLVRRSQGLTWKVGRASWSPWQGFHLGDVHARIANSPDEIPDFIIVKETSVQPYWKESLKGKPVFREIVVDRPELNLPLELFFVQSGQPVAPPPAPQPPEPPVEKPKQPRDESAPRKPTATPKPSPTPRPPRPAPPEVVEPGKWLRVRDAQLRVYSLRGPSVEVRGLDFEAPFSGPAARGRVSWKAIAANGQELIPASTFEFDWKNPAWVLPARDLEFAGLKMRLGGSLGIRQGQRPFQFQLAIPQQAVPEREIHQESGAYFSAEQVALALQISGQLARLETWSLDFAASGRNLHGGSHLREKDHRFETAAVQVQLRQQVFACPGFELRSPDLSLMGNGFLGFNGVTLGVLRIVASPEIESQITRIAVGSMLSEGWTSHWMQPLETPDRYYRDLHFEGMLPDGVLVDTGRKGEEMTLNDALSLFRRFLKTESSEELPLSH